mmetsp:Transcript_6225/g.14888  ORF Transcript_6225/g.14888 Transcript_6225/m.14888 type:complete len:196 (-) Transcript_6225:177-764(-)
MVATWTRILGFVASICGVLAVFLIAVYICLRIHVARSRAAKQAHRAKTKESETPQQRDRPNLNEAASQPTARHRKSADHEASKPRAKNIAAFERDAAVVQKEQDLKRDALHVFRRLHACRDKKDRGDLCKEAVALFDSLSSRLGTTMAAITSGKIIFCNALMECGGLEELQECKDADEPNATALIERVVPVIFSS